ncbi:MAG TPA: DUF58 domain-containing protein [Pirellulales bacterium]|nr:DUF58 domain-containing protein [Pirellulales bacterium]
MSHRRFRISLTFEGACFAGIAVFILAGALTRQINLLMVLFGLLAGAFFMHWRMVTKMLRNMEVARRLPKSVSAGDLLVVELTGVNARRRLGAWSVVATDTVCREDERGARPVRARALFSYVPAGATRNTNYRGRLAQRGRYRFGPLQLSSRFPFGFLQYRMRFDAYETMLVFPRLGRLTAGWRRWQDGLETRLGSSSPRQGFLEGDFYGLRDWRSGDSRRWLHWRTSARRQTPVVRQFEQQRDRGLAVVLELWQPDRPGPAESDAVEMAVSFVATLVDELCRAGGRGLCVAIAGRPGWLVDAPASAALLEEVMCQLASSEATSDDTLPQTLSNVFDRIRRGTQTLIVSTRTVDLDDERRFALLCHDGQRRKWLSRLKTVNSSDSSLSELFQVS